MNKPSKRWRRPSIINLYLLRVVGTDIYKIGYTSKHPLERMRVIRYYLKDFATIELIDFVQCDFRYEKMFHNRFKSHNIKIGYFNEFFLLDEYCVELIKSFFTSKKNKILRNG